MKKLNLVLIAFAFIMLVGIVFSFSVALAEDQQAAVQKMDKDKSNDGMGMMCPMMSKMDDEKGMDMKKMDMGKGMMCQCPMMDKMKGDMPMGNMQMKSPDMMAYIEKLQLTPDQRDKMDSAKIAHHKDMIRKSADRDIAQIELEELMRKDEPNLTAIGDQLKKIANMEADLKLSQIKIIIDLKAILTKEQKDNLKMMMEHDRMNMPMGKMEQKGMQQLPAPKQLDKSVPEPMKDMKMK